MARVLVTGATGFIGKRLVEHLLRRGDDVRCLVHQKKQRLAGVECVHADITVPETLERLVQGVEIVYHLAGATLVASPHRYQAINGLGTRNLGQAFARRTSPPVLVYLSSLAAAGPSAAGKPRREEEPPAPVSKYGRSKLMGERYLRQVAGQLPVTVLRPPGVFGPGDVNLLPLFKIARWGVNLVPGSLDQQLAFIYVDDLIEALPQAAERGERLLGSGAVADHPRGIYFVAMEGGWSLAELGHFAGAALGERHGVSPPVRGRTPPGVRTLVVPPWLAKTLARANDFLARLTMQPMLLTSDKMQEALARSWLCSSAKAQRAWGFTCRTGLAEGLQKTVHWYRRQSWL